MNKLKLQTEIHIAEIDRSLALVGQAWEDNKQISIDEMCKHLEAIGNVVDQTATFSEFILETNLIDLKSLN